MDMFDKAAFAQVPLRLTGDATDPVAVRPEADGAYRVGVSPLWRLGKKTLGLYVSRRFRRGQPFHAGTAWQGHGRRAEGHGQRLGGLTPRA